MFTDWKCPHWVYTRDQHPWIKYRFWFDILKQWEGNFLSRIFNTVDAWSIRMLYNSQVSPLMEYCPLSWNRCHKSHCQRQDNIRDRAQCLINWKRSSEDSPITLQQLQHRRDVSVMCVFYIVHKTGVEYLHSLRGTKAKHFVHSLRRSGRREEGISVPRSRTEQY